MVDQMGNRKIWGNPLGACVTLLFVTAALLAITLYSFVFAQGSSSDSTSSESSNSSSCTPPIGSSQPQSSLPYELGVVLVQYNETTFRFRENQAEGDGTITPIPAVNTFFTGKRCNPVVTDIFYDLRTEVIHIGNNIDPLQFMTELIAIPGVVHVQPNFFYEQNAPFFGITPTNFEATGIWHLNAIDAYDAWRVLTADGKTYVPKIGVVDSGILTLHPDFAGRIPKIEDCKIRKRSIGRGRTRTITGNCNEGGYDYQDNDFDVDHEVIDYDNFHGTTVSGAAAASIGNGNAAGVAPFADIVPIRVGKNSNGKFSTKNIIKGLVFARRNNIDIVNMSLGSYGVCSRNFYNPSFWRIFTPSGRLKFLEYQVIDKFPGVVTTSAGNNSIRTGIRNSLHIPSDFSQTIDNPNHHCNWIGLDNLISVGGTEEGNDINGDGTTSSHETKLMTKTGVKEVRWFNEGTWRLRGSPSSGSCKSCGSSYSNKLDIFAPGDEIVAPYPTTSGTGSSKVITGYTKSSPSGTSLAAPQIAGVAALMLRADKSLTGSQLKTKITESADELITLVGPDCTAGTSDDYVKNGRRVNAYNAVQAALGQSYTKKTITHADRAACLCAGSPGCEYGECGTSVNTCLSGTPDDNAVPDTTVRYRWVCKGRNGGIDSETCSVLREGGSCSSCTTDLGAVSSTVTRTNESLESSCASESRTNAYAKYYTFTLRSPAVITIDLTSSVDTYLFLHRHDSEEQCSVGEKIIENDDIVGGNTNSRVHKAVASGKYTIEATTYSPRKTGSFNLTITTGQTTKTRRCTSCATWNDWTPVITNQCGDVRQTRSCRTKSPVGCGGSIASETRTTTISAVNGEWSDWGNWSACTCTPDISDDSTVGTQTRTRTCSNPAPSCGGTTCSGSSTETQSCVTSRCAVNTVVNGGWSAWGSCGCTSSKTDSKTAGIQYRSCTNPAPSGGGARCSGSAVRSCNTSGCAVDGRWSNWSPCRCTTSKTDSATAGIQYRSCTNPAPSGGGAQCSGASSQSCNTSGCAVAPTCRWQRTSCGNKACGPQQAVCGPADCIGTCIYHGGRRIQGGNTVTFAGGCGICSGGKVCNNSGQCVTSIPRVNGGWSAWGSCGCTSSKTDSATAGIQYRSCTNPAPSGGGTQCSGASSQSCNTSGCAVTPTCSWQRTSCGSKVCGPQQAVCGPSDCTGTCPYTGGTRAQRGNTGSFTNGCGTCSGGKTCNTSGQCVTSTTPRVNGGWSAWGSCGCTTSKTDSATAGIQYRSCTNPAPSGGGTQCSGASSQSCNTSGCAVTPTTTCSWQGNNCTNKCGIITGVCGPDGCTGTCGYTSGRRAQPGATGTRNCGSCDSGYTCSSNRCVRSSGTWSNWGSCRCTTSKTDSSTAGVQYRSCSGGTCSGSSSQSCTTSGCAVAPTCSWQRTSCGSKVCGPQRAVCGPSDCTGTCPYTGGTRAQRGNTGSFTDGCGTCSGGKTCNTSGQCVTVTPRVNGGWSAWGSCGCTSSKTDSATAGIQYRSCTNPRPSGGGANCSGSSSRSCTTSGCAVSCSSTPCSESCRSSITWGSCHAGHTHSGNYRHTQPQRHGSYTCHGSTEIKWKSENCTLSCGSWSNRYCGTAAGNTNKVRRHRDCNGTRQWETVQDCSTSGKRCVAGYCF